MEIKSLNSRVDFLNDKVKDLFLQIKELEENK